MVQQTTVSVESVTLPVVVKFLEEDGIYQVSCPWLQGCHAWGDTLDEAMRAIPGNIRAMIEARRLHGNPLPEALVNRDAQGPFVLQVALA